MAKLDLIYRYSEIEPAKIDRAARKIPLAFSSEFPAIQRNSKPNSVTKAAGLKPDEIYIEVLSHDEADVDLSSLNNRGAFLDEHDHKDHLGFIENASLDATERVGRADIVLDATDKGKNRFEQMATRSRPHVSAGYVYTKFVGDVKLENGRTAKKFAWEAREISSVAVPADPTIGVGRKAADLADLPTRDLSKLMTRDGDGKEISLEGIRQFVRVALAKCEAFTKTPAGNSVQCYAYVNDIVQDGESWTALVETGGKFFSVPFTLVTGGVTLGDPVEVKQTVVYEPVAASRSALVDFAKLSEAELASALDKLTPEEKTRMKNIFGRPAVNLDPAAAAGGGGAATATPVDETKIRVQVESETRKKVTETLTTRNKEITDCVGILIKENGKKNGGKLAEQLRKIADESISNPDVTIDQFKVRCLTEVAGAKAAQPVLIRDLSNGEDTSSYSVLRGVQSCIKNKTQVPDGLEGEMHEEILSRAKTDGGLGYDAQGFQVPADAPMRSGYSRRDVGTMTRDMQATIFGAGGAFVPTQLVVPIIEILRNLMVLERVGVRRMAGLQGNIVIPRQESAATAYSVSEIQALTDSQQVLGQIALNPKRVGATQTYSKQFVMQSTPDAEAFMRDDLFKVIALAWDRLGLNGQGAASEPLGIINAPGVGSVLFGATPTYAKIVSFETAIRAANVTDPLVYLTTRTVKGTLKITPASLTGSTVVSGASNALWTRGSGEVGAGEINGYPAYDSNQIPNNLVIAGAFNHLIHAIWGGLDVVVDQVTKAKNAEIVLTINTWGDFAVRHPQAFVVSADAGNQ